MKFAFLIAAHHQPRHLGRLLRALDAPDCAAFVHLDAKSPMAPFFSIGDGRVQLVETRVPVYWGEFSQVEATLIMLRAAFADPASYDYFALLSGSDYPIAPITYVKSFFRQHSGMQFINCVPMPHEAAGKPLARLLQYRVQRTERAWIAKRAVRRLLVGSRLTPGSRDYRRAFRQLRPFAGSSWWALSRAACQHVLHFVERETEVVDFFRNTWFPDEMFFQTILANSPFCSDLRRSLTYTDWSAGGSHPAPIEARHLELFSAERVRLDDVYGTGEALFARKFSESGAPVVDALDGILERKREALSRMS